jgi:adenosylmethionine-8-amino-7-oxononanoate aminotransferase
VTPRRPSNAGPSGNWVDASLPKVAYGKGLYVFDSNGQRYIDASGGPAVFCLGHGHDEVNGAIKRQLDRIAHGYRYAFTSDPLEELRERVAEASGPGLDRMVFVSGGSEAVESALKIALQYHAVRGEMSRRRFISRRRSWHGNTLGALAVSDFLVRRARFEGALVDASFLSSVSSYRPPAGVAPQDVAMYCAAELEAEIVRLGQERVAAFIFEPVVGAAGAVVPAPTGYARLVRDVCTRHGVLLIADEVMCGSGRCGTWRALEHDGVVPDIMAVAKGLGGGYVPLGAVVYHRNVSDVIVAADGGPNTGHTFTGHTLACAAGVAVQTVIQREGLVERVRRDGPRFQELLRDRLRGIEAVGDVRGRGFFVGIEFVADGGSREPFDPRLQVSSRVGRAAAANGLLCYPVAGNVDGIRGDAVILAPPYNASDDELVMIADYFGTAVRTAVGDLGSGHVAVETKL